MDGALFTRAELTVLRPQQTSLAPKCGACGLYKTCKTPKMKVYGRGKKQVLVIGEAPGEEEDKRGRPFVGPAGVRLRRSLRRLGVDLDEDCWATNALICRPPGNKIAKDDMIDWCRPNVLKAIEALKPTMILLLGNRPLESVVGHLYKENPGGIMKWAGWRVPCQKWNAWVCPTYHPSFVMRKDEERRTPDHAEQVLFDRHLKRAFGLKGRPFKTVPDYPSQVLVSISPEEGAANMRRMLEAAKRDRRPLAFDYETNCIAPWGKGRIYAVSLSDGRFSIACPWHGPVIDAAKEMILSDLPKIGANIKFEELWTYAKLGVWVKNHNFDTVTTAHALDNREGVSGVKFQAFARLGQEDYAHLVKRYLEAEAPGKYALNRIHECDLRTLLHYCGMDALVEWHIARHQERELENVAGPRQQGTPRKGPPGGQRRRPDARR